MIDKQLSNLLNHLYDYSPNWTPLGQLLLLMAFYISGTGVLNIVTPLTPMSDQDRISPYNMRLLLLL